MIGYVNGGIYGCSASFTSCVHFGRARAMSTESGTKTVLVHFGERARPVRFCGGVKDLLSAIQSSFQDVLSGDEQMILQVCLAVCTYTSSLMQVDANTIARHSILPFCHLADKR